MINAKKISKGTTRIIILNIINKLLSMAIKMGFLAHIYIFISLAIEGYLFYLIPNKNIFDVFYFPTKQILKALPYYFSIRLGVLQLLCNIIEILEVLYFARIVYLD